MVDTCRFAAFQSRQPDTSHAEFSLFVNVEVAALKAAAASSVCRVRVHLLASVSFNTKCTIYRTIQLDAENSHALFLVNYVGNATEHKWIKFRWREPRPTCYEQISFCLPRTNSSRTALAIVSPWVKIASKLANRCEQTPTGSGNGGDFKNINVSWIKIETETN